MNPIAWLRSLTSPKPEPRVGLLVTDYWALRGSFRKAGVYRGVLEDTLYCGEVPAYYYDKGTEVATFDEEGRLTVFTLQKKRLFVPMRRTLYEDEPERLDTLRGALPEADELRILLGADHDSQQRDHRGCPEGVLGCEVSYRVGLRLGAFFSFMAFRAWRSG